MDDLIIKRDIQTLAPIDQPPAPSSNEIAAVDTTDNPDVPIADARVESFLSEIIDTKVCGTDDYLRAYRRAGFPADAPPALLRNELRVLMSKPRVKARLNFMRQAEWDMNKPDKIYVSNELKAIIDGYDMRPADRINAINSLAKLVGMFDDTEVKETGNTIINFNSQEAPAVAIQINKPDH